MFTKAQTKRRGIGWVAAFAGLLSISPAHADDVCTPANPGIQTVTPGILTVSSHNLSPYIYEESPGKFVGIDAEIIQQFARDHCLAMNHVVVEGAAVIQYVVSGRADVTVGSWYRTAERAKVLGISDPIYLQRLAIYSHDGATQFDQLLGRSVGTVQGYLWVPELRKLYGDQLKLYPSPVAMTQDMSAGRVDAGINDLSLGLEAKKLGALSATIQLKVPKPDARVRSSVFPAQTGFLYSKDNHALGAALNQTIAAFRQSGALGRLMEKYERDASATDVGAPRYVEE